MHHHPELLHRLFGDDVTMTDDRPVIANPAVLESEKMDGLARAAVFGDGQEREVARWILWQLGQATGVRPASIHELYMARGRGDQWVGPTPIAALGATDQHSQVQLFMEGPQDKTVTFIAVGEEASDVAIPALHGDIPELAYLGGHRLGELLDIERRATAGALARRGRPNMTIAIDRVDPWHFGALVMMLEIATIHAGTLYGVNPLDQPGVELGKQFTYAMLGRADAEQARQEWNLLPKPNPEHVT